MNGDLHVNDPLTDSTAPALFLIGHGTRSAMGVSQFEAFAKEVAAARPSIPVGSGFIELVAPELQTGIDQLVDRGVTSLVGVPMVLFGAGHMKDDGPVALERARRRHPTLATSYAREMGPHPLVLSAAAERIRQATDRPADAVVVVGRGSSDPDANADLAKVARLLADSRDLGTGLGTATALTPEGGRGANPLGLVEPAFVSLAAPDVATALERVYRLGARRITVVPYFLFFGILIDRIRHQAEAWAAGYPDVTLAFGTELGVDDRLVELVWERYDEAVGGGTVMNCDGCVYRAPLPGYEDRVGAPPFG
jgi:sirohydrochlorin cobaltochelatase